jgi:hypothetical protein
MIIRQTPHNLHYVDYERLHIEEFSGDGARSPHNPGSRPYRQHTWLLINVRNCELHRINVKRMLNTIMVVDSFLSKQNHEAFLMRTLFSHCWISNIV